MRSVNVLKLFIERLQSSLPVRAHIDAGNVSGTCRSRMAVRLITCSAFIIDNYVTRLVIKHRILVFKLDFKLDLLQMALNFMLLQDGCIRPIRVRSKEVILNITDN